MTLLIKYSDITKNWNKILKIKKKNFWNYYDFKFKFLSQIISKFADFALYARIIPVLCFAKIEDLDSAVDELTNLLPILDYFKDN